MQAERVKARLAYWFWSVLAVALLAGPAFTRADTAEDPFATQVLAAPSPATSINTPHVIQPCNFDATNGAPLTLPDVVERALCNNPQTREAWANARAQAAQVGIGESAFLPSIDASGSLSHNDTGNTTSTQNSVGVTLTYLLYDFGGRDAALENAKQVLAATNATQDATLQSVFLAAVQAYYQLFATQAAVNSAREAEQSSRESFNAAAARYSAGAATPADKLQAQTAYSQAALNRVRAEGNASNAQGVLANVMGLDANHTPVITPPRAQAPDVQFEADVARLIETARRHRPDLAAAEAQIKAAEANVAVVQASGKPSLSFSSNLNRTDASGADPLNSSAAGITLSIPLFTGYNTTYRTQSARAQVEARVAQRDRLSQQVALDVWRAYQDLITETRALQTSADLLASAAQSERVALGRYKEGVGNILDALNAQSALASARQQNVQSLYNWHIAKATLAQSMGQLELASVGAAALPVQ